MIRGRDASYGQIKKKKKNPIIKASKIALLIQESMENK